MAGPPGPAAGAASEAEVRSPSAASATPRCSVVVSTYNRAGFLPDLLGALEAQTVPAGTFEVVVVDNGSTDDTWPVLGRLVAASSLAVLAVRLDANRGAGGGRNAGVARARGGLVAFTDDDCLPTPGWLAALLAAQGGGPVVAQGRTEPWPGDRAQAGPWDRTVWVLGPTWLFETCNIAYRRSDLVAAGGFPDAGRAPRGATGRAFGEDVVAGWAVLGAGARLVFAADAVVHHRHLPASYRQWLAEQRGRGGFPALVARVPAARRALWGRVFLAPRTACFDAAAAGLLLALWRRRPGWAVPVLAWLALAQREARERRGAPLAVRLAQLAAGDAVGAWWLLAGSLRHRAPVL